MKSHIKVWKIVTQFEDEPVQGKIISNDQVIVGYRGWASPLLLAASDKLGSIIIIDARVGSMLEGHFGEPELLHEYATTDHNLIVKYDASLQVALFGGPPATLDIADNCFVLLERTEDSISVYQIAPTR